MVPLINAAFRGTQGANGWTTEAHLVEGMRAEPGELATTMANPDARFELAHDDAGALLGCVYLRREPDAVCYLGMLSVDPTRQTGGVGSALMLHSESLARGWGCACMRITIIDARPELRAYYERRGYTLTGRSDPFPTTKRSRPKVEGLRFVEMMKALA